MAAPVDYVPRDFVLYMFGTFCRAVVASFCTRVRELPRTALIAAWLIRRRRLIWAWSWRLALAAWAVAMIFWARPVARWLPAPLSWLQDLCIAMLAASATSPRAAFGRRPPAFPRWPDRARHRERYANGTDHSFGVR